MRSAPVLVLLLAMSGCSSSRTPPNAPAPPATGEATTSTRWSLTATAGDEPCEIRKEELGLTWGCSDGQRHAVRSDASDVVERVGAIDWTAEAARSEPEQVGPVKRAFGLRRGDALIELYRYPDSSTPVGALGAAFERLIAAERSMLGSHRPRSDGALARPRFPAVADPGLVTVQEVALRGEEAARSIRVEASGEWSTSGDGGRRGTLSRDDRDAVRSLVDEASGASPVPGEPEACDAVPDHGVRVLLGEGREVQWVGPCGSPPPPGAALLVRYLRHAVEGRPSAERAQMLRDR